MTLARLAPNVELEAIRGLAWKAEMRTIIAEVETAAHVLEAALEAVTAKTKEMPS